MVNIITMVLVVKMLLIVKNDEIALMISSVPKRRALFHDCFLSFQPHSMAVVVSSTPHGLYERGRLEVNFLKDVCCRWRSQQAFTEKTMLVSAAWWSFLEAERLVWEKDL
jgi:hypothetical protein